MTEKPGVPRRELSDPGVLRAMAHPLRLSLLEHLATVGQATASELADRVDESPANCSWHLRQLAKYGFIEEGTGGTGRQRPWRWISQSVGVAQESDDEAAELTHARNALLEVMMNRELEAWRAWEATKAQAPEEWNDASFGVQSFHLMTAEELAALKADVNAVVDKHVLAKTDRVDPERRPADARGVRFVAWAIPAGPPADLPRSETRSE